MTTTLKTLEEKKLRLDGFRPLDPALLSNLQEWFRVELTYTSNAIEGNTLSRAETALIVDKGITVEGKTLREHLEAVNHAEAFDWILKHIDATRQDITEDTILELHQMILQRIMNDQAGRFRTVPVRIAGSAVIMPNALKVPDLMREFVSWLQTNQGHPVTVAVDAHLKLVSIHPFVDGNGRTARLLLNLLLMQAGYPPAIIRTKDRASYISSIEKIQLGGSPEEYYSLMYAAVDRSLDVYLEALEGKEHNKQPAAKDLLKIGELAQLTGETVPTIRHWTKEGLLTVAQYSPGGYQLYSQEQHMVAKKIRSLQSSKRLTIPEIKRIILHTA